MWQRYEFLHYNGKVGEFVSYHPIFFVPVVMKIATSFIAVLPQRIPLLPIGELGYRALGRGGAVGAGRELPAHLREPASAPGGHSGVCSDVACRVAIKTDGLHIGGRHGMGMVAGRRWAGKSSRCEDPAPTVSIAGRALRGYIAAGPHLRPRGPNRNGVEVDNDAARRVATSSKKRENRI